MDVEKIKTVTMEPRRDEPYEIGTLAGEASGNIV